MSSFREGLRLEARPMMRLALPVVLGEVGWMSMGVVDTMMIGRVSPEALGAASIGRAVFMMIAVLGVGLLLGLDTLVSHAYGAGRIDECRRWLVDGSWVAVLLSAPFTFALFAGDRAIRAWGLEPTVAKLATGYLGAVTFSLLPLLVFTAFRRYLQAVGRVRAIMVALITANVVNAVGNYAMIFGRLGAPEMGVVGAGWATVISSVYMMLFLIVAAWLEGRDERTRGTLRLGFDRGRTRRLLRLGVPAMLQLGLELGAFTLATLLVGRLAAAELAAHQVALTMASLTFMVPLGVSAAGAVRVGQALGRADPAAAARAGWTAICFGAGFMTLPALAFVLFPRTLVRLFTPSPEVAAIGVSLLLVAAIFQLFDGLQVVGTGVLRGFGDTRTPMIWNLVGHWAIGLPLGWWLCFPRGLGVVGLWIGLASGLVVVGLVLLGVWARRARMEQME